MRTVLPRFSNTGLYRSSWCMPVFPFLFFHFRGITVNSNLLIVALIVGLHLDPLWAFLLILIALIIKLLPARLVLELFTPAIIAALRQHRRKPDEH